MIPPSAGKFLLLTLGGGLVFVGVGFFGLAVFMLLRIWLDVVGAAALTALALLSGPAGWAIWKRLAPPAPLHRTADSQTAALSVLANLAREHPLLAVLGAGVLGAAQHLLRRR